MTIHLEHLPLSATGLDRWGGRRGWAKGAFDQGRALHHLVDEMFGPSALRPFRLMIAQGGQMASLYAYSGQNEVELREVADVVATPDHLTVADPAALRCAPS